MIEEYDDSDDRRKKVETKEAEMPPKWVNTGNPSADREKYLKDLDAWIAATAPKSTPCPYCLFAKKGGAPGDRDHRDSKGMVHKVKVASITSRPALSGTKPETIWHLDAACGATFQQFMDSSD